VTSKPAASKAVAIVKSVSESAVAIMKSVSESVTVKSVTESPAEPRADSDEYSVYEVTRSPVAIRRTSIRIITKIAVRADGRRTIRAIVSVISSVAVVVLRLHASY
jgi:hypothetical protein